VSKGGNYLLNVGPMANGVIPGEAQNNLRTVGRWLKINGEAVYGAGPMATVIVVEIEGTSVERLQA
jgi:alpha-L-fucosidase